MTIKQMIKKARYIYGYVQTCDHEGLYCTLIKKDVLELVENNKEVIDASKFELRRGVGKSYDLYIN